MSEGREALATVDGESGYRVTLPVFEGPLDLLLHLVKEQKLDIATVPLASLAEQYLQYVHRMEELDVEMAADYLVIAATLVFLKSKSLLPPVPSDFVDEEAETPEEVEERLRARLIVYSKFRDIGEQLRARQVDAAAFHYREGADPASDLTQRYRIDSEKLGRALIFALRNARPERRTIARERLSLLAQMDFIMLRIRQSGEALFSELCSGLGRESIIVTFLAILELIRRRRVDFEQAEAFEDIRIFRARTPHIA
ncbi:MAG: segregation/condensation protein A [Candidatus Eremiobacteraeota bacterium]|nr:segregation/condensation protein A [Candidatus Eremiobacteraeota bacterium]